MELGSSRIESSSGAKKGSVVFADTLVLELVDPRESILTPPAHSRQERDDRTEVETEGRTTHGLQLQLGMSLLLRRASHLRQVRDGPCLPNREGQLRRGGARRFEVHPRRGVAEGDSSGTR